MTDEEQIHGEDNPEAEARRARAAELHETIERLKSDRAEDEEPAARENPREFTDRKAHEAEDEGEPGTADDV